MAQRLREKVWWCEGEESEEGECDADFVLDLELDPESHPCFVVDDVDARSMSQMASWLDRGQLEEQRAADKAMAKAKRQGNHGEASIVYISDDETDKAKKRRTSSA